MARKRITQGMSVDDILIMSMSKFQQYSDREQKEIVSRLVSAANKRLRRLEKNDIVNPATLRVDFSGGKFSTAWKSGTDLENELYRAKSFMKSKFSTMRGWKDFNKKIDKEININDDNNDTDSDNKRNLIKLAYSYYDYLSDLDPRIRNKSDKYKVVDKITESLESGKKGKDVINSALKYIKEAYKQEQDRYNDTNVTFGDLVDYDIPDRLRRGT